jgi:hypothetical protein
VTDGQLTEAATHYLGEPVEVHRIMGTLTEDGAPVEVAELLRLTTLTPPKAVVMLKVEHTLLDDLPWPDIRYHVIRPMRDSIRELRASNN